MSLQLLDIDAKLKEIVKAELLQKKTPASFFNLIIYTQKGQRDESYWKLIHSVISKFPSRVLWIREEKKVDAYLKTDVRTVSITPNIFCEIIEIDVAGSYKERVPSLVLPHLLPDLPLYLLFAEDPTFEKVLFPLFAPMAKKIILDGTLSDNFQDYCKTAFGLASKFPGVIADLHWRAQKGWRNLFIGIFDTPEILSTLASSKRIEITYNSQQKVKNEELKAAFFQGWLSSCFGWQFKTYEKNGDITKILYSFQDKPITVTLMPSNDPNYNKLPPRVLLTCEIESYRNNAHFRFKRNYQGPELFYQYSDKTECALPCCHHIPGVPDGQEIIEELFYQTEDSHLKKMLNILKDIPWECE